MSTDRLPTGLQVRAPREDELAAVTDLIVACDIADTGEADTTIEDMQADWERPGFHLPTDAWVLEDGAGQIIGYTDIWKRAADVYIAPNTCVHPAYRGRNLESYLYQWAENAARAYYAQQEPGRPWTLTTISVTPAIERLLEQRGYRPIQYQWRMEIALDTPPPPVTLPADLTLRTFVPGQDDHGVYTLMDEAFSDLAHHTTIPFEDWRQRMMGRDDFDPTLWYLVFAGEELVGMALGYAYPNSGWVRQLAVRKTARGRGIGLQLLYQAFGTFYARGFSKVGLVVDAQNATGATRLYERAGMHSTQQLVTYEKELTVP